METRRIGTLEVSVIGLGCNNFGWKIDESATRRVIDTSIERGINFLDTADTYGKTKSEEFIGRALEGRRASVIIATKFGKPVDPTRTGARPEYVHQACNDSLRRLRTDYIDLYQLHAPDPTVPIADTLGALDELVTAGKVREIGCSNFSGEQLREADEASRRRQLARFASVQNHYNMLRRDDEADAIPECERLGIAYLPYFPLESGLLTGKYRLGKSAPAGTRIAEGGWLASKFTNDNLAIIERLIAFAESRRHTLLELAISWLLRHSVVASVIAGATSPDQVSANATAASWKLTSEDIDAVDQILLDA
ncbi:MAG TPA: aldo/keto reductase [Gemmatimonadaceae bacterium]|nr:aldo/keto reductase [Gemmatimonadaceae bacterium]